MHKTGDIFYLYPEYCSGPFYMGWHIYERDRNDGSINDSGDWGWIRSSSLWMDGVKRLCDELGHSDMPAVVRYEGRFIDEFARRFPNGILVRLGEYHRYEIVKGA